MAASRRHGDDLGACFLEDAHAALCIEFPAQPDRVVQRTLQGNFDFGLLDMRVTRTFANAERYQYARTPHIVCPYDYYEGN